MMRNPRFKEGDIVIFRVELLKNIDHLMSMPPTWNEDMTAIIKKSPLLRVVGTWPETGGRYRNKDTLQCIPASNINLNENRWLYHKDWVFHATPELERAVKFEMIL